MSSNAQDKTIRVGSRKSELALIQTKHVIARLQKIYPHRKFEIHTMSTIGDRVLNISLPKIGEKSLFTRDLEDALRNGGVDFVVHSLKDLPTALPLGMAIGAVLEREDARDALVLRENLKGHTIDTLPKGSVIGTSSLRRTAQIKRQYPDLIVCDIRGNLNTRLAKLDAADSKFSGIILAQAGLVRMGWQSRISQVLEPTDLLYAVGQGALAVECRANDADILEMLRRLICMQTTCRILAERSFLKTLGGGCSAPVAVWSNLNGDVTRETGNEAASELYLTGAVWSLDGVTEIRQKRACLFSEVADGGGGSKRLAVDAGGASTPDSPPLKRSKKEGSGSGEESPTQQLNRRSPPVISDDPDVGELSSSYNVKQLIEKHIDLAKLCPYVGINVQTRSENGSVATQTATATATDRNIGDVSCSAAAGDAHCPVHMDVGQDFMGKCPFIGDQAKVDMAHAGKCPLTTKSENGTKSSSVPNPTSSSSSSAPSTDETDRSRPSGPSSSLCPYASSIAAGVLSGAGGDFVRPSSPSDAHGKCPFLQKSVQMFHYADEEKPKAGQVAPVLIDDVEKLFCGLYQHDCHNRALYERSESLGRELAEELIKEGALDVMKLAQAEIHSKA